MRLYTSTQFLTKQTEALPKGYVAAGIHPSSEVDLVDISGQRLGVGGVVPLIASQSMVASSVRHPLTGDQLIGADSGNITVTDGDLEPGGRLVLQLYEACDALVPPGPRWSYYKDVQIAAGALPTTADLAQLAMRIPFHGRSQCTIGMWRGTNAADLSIFVVGRSYGRRDAILRGAFLDQEGVYWESATETWWNGGGAASVESKIDPGATESGLYKWRVVQVGGLGDAAETYDELQLFAFGAAGGVVRLFAEAFGDRR